MNTLNMQPSDYLHQQFGFPPTAGQAKLFELLNDFILDKERKRKAFLLKGYAGTGKTTVVSALVQVLKRYNHKTLMLAPTGRAAKVMSIYAKKMAFTIHKIIFTQKEDPNTGVLQFKRQRNYYTNTVFIVDEASMIDDRQDISGRGLLTELVNYVYENPDSGNKLLLIGDTAQLPPVHQTLSPALDPDYLSKEFRLDLTSHLLTEVVRQEAESGILFNATSIRNEISKHTAQIGLVTKSYKDVYRMTADKLEDGLRYGYDKFGIENTVIICRSNRTATQYNQYIRRAIHFREDELEAGDHLMVVRNNYHWLPEDSPAGFLANGEFIEVMAVRNVEEMHGFRFADLTIRLIDYENHPKVEVKVHLDTLHSFTPNLSREDNRKLFESVVAGYADVEDKKARNKMIREDAYLNALQVKFAYALTCHKSQGGQWDAVFVDQGFLTDEMLDHDFMRWLYTAMTRSRSELYLMNFKPEFFK
ncbi:AAA family ATPase [Limibacter armeniacum]|uniref:ATP-dependent DNA helicase n=1 Tax=Limibacter armeniacum TaxID=466084 RepID=UPI002FE6260C